MVKSIKNIPCLVLGSKKHYREGYMHKIVFDGQIKIFTDLDIKDINNNKMCLFISKHYFDMIKE